LPQLRLTVTKPAKARPMHSSTQLAGWGTTLPGRTVFQRLSDTVPARGRGYFDIQVPVSPSYQVNVESFGFTLGSSGS
jgi:hypothetical protein